jgi:hypothetical protein
VLYIKYLYIDTSLSRNLGLKQFTETALAAEMTGHLDEHERSNGKIPDQRVLSQPECQSDTRTVSERVKSFSNRKGRGWNY